MSSMRIGMGLSKTKDPEGAIQEAYRKSLQKLGATKADLCLVLYSYDYALDLSSLSGALKRVLRQIPHIGCSTWGAWSNKEAFEGESAVIVFSFKDPSFQFEFFRVHSLREKAELWSAELSRHIMDSSEAKKKQPDLILVLADSLNFASGNGFNYMEAQFPKTQICGMGTSFSVPQCSLVCNGEIHMNCLVALSITGIQPWIGLLQNIKSELNPVSVNRMSENLVIEMDQKPAFYRLCEHLMQSDDLPMMSPDDFRRHMGNLYLVEKAKVDSERLRTLGQSYRVIPLLGSEMTTGMVAVANALDFSQVHYLGQKKATYAEEEAKMILQKLKEQIPNPSIVWLLSSANRFRDPERESNDLGHIEAVFPGVPVVGIATNGEYLGGLNQSAALVIAFP